MRSIHLDKRIDKSDLLWRIVIWKIEKSEYGEIVLEMCALCEGSYQLDGERISAKYQPAIQFTEHLGGPGWHDLMEKIS
jgi:hypothetical protein